MFRCLGTLEHVFSDHEFATASCLVFCDCKKRYVIASSFSGQFYYVLLNFTATTIQYNEICCNTYLILHKILSKELRVLQNGRCGYGSFLCNSTIKWNVPKRNRYRQIWISLARKFLHLNGFDICLYPTYLAYFMHNILNSHKHKTIWRSIKILDLMCVHDKDALVSLCERCNKIKTSMRSVIQQCCSNKLGADDVIELLCLFCVALLIFQGNINCKNLHSYILKIKVLNEHY